MAIFAHPGHELRILHALGELGASCLYLTDASGSTGASRLPLTTDLLQKAGLPARTDFPFIPDAVLYSALRRRNEKVFDKLAEELDRIIAKQRPQFLITDSAEGYNPAHDICHFLSVRTGHRHGLQVYDIALDGDPGDHGHANAAECLAFELGPEQLSHKLELIRRYIALAGDKLAQEARHLFALYGEAAQASEILRPALAWPAYDREYCVRPPFFESHGRQRVREGKYTSALTYREHLRPLLAAMMQPA